MAAARIATVVIGPQAGGRGYRVLARSEGPAISGVAEGRLGEMALVLAGWAEEREPPAAALIPLTDATAPALLMRFAFLGSAALGTIAYAHGLILDAAAFAACGGRPETLLPLIPPPDGSRTFGDAPLTFSSSASPAPAKDWTGLGLEWRDRLILVDHQAEEEPILGSILRSIGPAGPGARVRGWATSALLPSSGSFAPARELQLLVVESARRRAPGLHHLPAQATATGFEGERVELPAAARAWERLKSLGAQDVEIAEAVGALRWLPELLEARAADAIRPAAGQALRALDGQARIRFILALARPRGDPLDADFAATARHWFAQLIGRENLDPQHAAFYLKALADGPTAATDAMAPLGPLLLKPGTGRWLRGRSFDRLLQLGYAEALAARAQEAPAMLAGLSSDDLPTLIGHILQSPDEGVRQPALISAALRELGGQIGGNGPPATWRDFFPAALRWRLNQPAGPDERLLGSRGVVRAVSSLAPAMLPQLAKRALRLRDTGSPRETLDMLGASLEWVRAKGAAA